MGSFMREMLELKRWHDSRSTGVRRGKFERPAPALRAEQLPDNERNQAEYIPTPEEIRAECLRIQSEWSDAERRRRSGQARRQMPDPVFRLLHVEE